MKKVFRIIVKCIFSLLIIGVLGFGILYALYDQPIPEGQSGEKADALAQKMLKAINNERYTSTQYLEWSFVGGRHKYLWDKKNGMVDVQWSSYLVKLDLISPQSSIVYDAKKRLGQEQSRELIEKAINYFNNDSFWLVAPFKIMDPGTKRSWVALEDGSDGLLVTYTEGGSTPGDSYLWKLRSNGFPESFQMWVKIIPIGGLEASWDQWQIMESGIFLPISHELGAFSLNMGSPKAYN